MSKVYQFELESVIPRSQYDINAMPTDYKYLYYVRNLRRAYSYQILRDLNKNVYDINMLDKIIDSGQLDDHGSLTIKAMKKLRFCYDDRGIEILN